MKALINILGVGRSGSTMLDLILGNAEDAFSCGEVYAWFHPWRKYHYNINCACGNSSCQVWEKIKACPEEKFHPFTAKALGVEYIIDSSKELVWVVDNNIRYQKSDIAVFNILIYKEPIDLAYSHYKRGQDIKKCKAIFKRYHRELIKTNIPFVTVNYSEFVDSPNGIIEKICRYTGMEYYSEKIYFWEKKYHHIFGSGGTRKQIGRESKIKRTPYSKDFKERQQIILKEFEDDNEFLAIMTQLKKKDIAGFVAQNSITKCTGDNVKSDIRLTRWYYRGKFMRRFWKTFPQPNLITELLGIFFKKFKKN